MGAATATYNDFRKHRRQHEQSELQQFINWIRREFPDVIVFCDAIGEDLSDTGRKRQSGLRTRRGISDVHIDHPSTAYNGHFYYGAKFEFKKSGTAIYKRDGKSLRKQSYKYQDRLGKWHIGDHLEEQAALLAEYNRKGYFGRFTVGLDQAKRLFRWYMGMPPDEPENAELF